MGATAPNPPVGAIAVDSNGKILATAAHQRAGTAHAEAALIEDAQRRGALQQIETLYVTLEPCNHHGRTPPCVDAIIASGIKRLVIGCRDPNPQVKGGGIERLRQAGIEVITGINEAECQQLIHPFAYFAETGMPWVTVKRALNREGSMLPSKGQKTFTSQSSLLLAHRLRKKADAILTGSGTILADDPEFTVRHVPDHPDKQRFLAILDRRHRVPESYLEATRQRGLEPLIFEDIQQALKALTTKGVRDILVEAGAALSQAVLDSSYWNMSVTIQQGEPDHIITTFNQQNFVPFKAETFNWDMFLPA